MWPIDASYRHGHSTFHDASYIGRVKREAPPVCIRITVLNNGLAESSEEAKRQRPAHSPGCGRRVGERSTTVFQDGK